MADESRIERLAKALHPTCKTCKFWDGVTCILISLNTEHSSAYTADEYRCYSTALYTKSDFGCNLHEGKPDAPTS